VRYTASDGDAMNMELGKDKSITALTGPKPSKMYATSLWAERGAQQTSQL